MSLILTDSNTAPKFLAIGPEFSGKSFLCQAMAAKEPRLITMLLREQKEYITGVVVRSRKEFTAALAKVYNRKRFRITWIVKGEDVKAGDKEAAKKVQAERAAALEHVFSTLYRLNMTTAPVAVHIDETDTFINGATNLGHYTREAAKQGRHDTPTPLYMTAHISSRLHHDLRANIQTIAIFKTKHDVNVTFIAGQSAGDMTKQEIAKSLNALGKYEYLLWSLFAPIEKMDKFKKA